MWPFKRRDRQAHEDQLDSRLLDSQRILLEAAASTADVAHDVTGVLRRTLADSVQQFETTARLIGDALIICDLAGRIRAFNPAAELMFATRAADIDGSTATALFILHGAPPAEAASLWAAIQDSPQAVRGVRRTGELFPSTISLNRLDRQDGSALMLLLLRDMTDAQESSRISEHHALRFQSLFDLSFDGILITQDDKVVAANQAAGLLFKKPADDLLDMPVGTLLDMAAPQGMPFETEVVHADGAVLPMLISTSAITWNGQAARLVTMKDLSDVRALQGALRRSVEPGMDMICVFGPDFSIRFANYLFHLYQECQHLAGRDIRDLLPEADQDGFARRLAGLTPERPRARSDEVGRQGIVAWTDQAAFDAHGRVVEYQRIGRDLPPATAR